MLTSGLSLCFAAFLTLMLWLGAAANASTQTRFTPSASAPTANAATLVTPERLPLSVAMTGKPLFHFSGRRPDQLGVASGKFSPCPATPNCVNSQASPSDREHFIPPLTPAKPAQAMATLKTVIQNLDRTEIITETPDYLYAEFTSALMGFVDDVEFWVDRSAGVIQVRSASRLGESDLGVNRRRIETIRAEFAEQEANL